MLFGVVTMIRWPIPTQSHGTHTHFFFFVQSYFTFRQHHRSLLVVIMLWAVQFSSIRSNGIRMTLPDVRSREGSVKVHAIWVWVVSSATVCACACAMNRTKTESPERKFINNLVSECDARARARVGNPSELHYITHISVFAYRHGFDAIPFSLHSRPPFILSGIDISL